MTFLQPLHHALQHVAKKKFMTKVNRNLFSSSGLIKPNMLSSNTFQNFHLITNKEANTSAVALHQAFREFLHSAKVLNKKAPAQSCLHHT